MTMAVPYSQLIHTAMNICEAGSLVRRRVFESGVLFDDRSPWVGKTGTSF